MADLQYLHVVQYIGSCPLPYIYVYMAQIYWHDLALCKIQGGGAGVGGGSQPDRLRLVQLTQVQ